MTKTSLKFQRRYPSGHVTPLGNAVQTSEGWKFFPEDHSPRRPSSKFHPTWESCVPRWVGYPNYCESHYVVQDGKPV